MILKYSLLLAILYLAACTNKELSKDANTGNPLANNVIYGIESTVDNNYLLSVDISTGQTKRISKNTLGQWPIPTAATLDTRNNIYYIIKSTIPQTDYTELIKIDMKTGGLTSINISNNGIIDRLHYNH